MRIGKFLAKLGIPLMAKNDLVEIIDITSQDINDTLLPILEDAQNVLTEFKSGPGKTWEADYKRERKQAFWPDITAFFQNASTCLARLREAADKQFNKDIAIDGIDYPRATILQLVGLYEFVTDYARRQISYLLAAEANVEARTLPLGKERPQGELKYLSTNKPVFFKALAVLSVKPDKLIKALDNIPEIRFDPDREDEQLATAGVATIDPLHLNFVDVGGYSAVNWNPFYLIGIGWASYKLKKLERLRIDKQVMQTRLEQLRLQKRGDADPILEKRIQTYEAMLDVVAKQIDKLEK
ncbi:hypothetical protein ACLPJK_26375 [Pseudomonas aeruginosa]|uniref:hypothetical protein n=1 Tax=Pseudomonas aeruginosa TaxID=287 RepID=UPI003D2918E3